ncbi:MAG: NUDIX domain-containing protein [Nitrososphaeraceae archaeon]
MERNKNLVYRAAMVPYIIEDGKIQMLFMRPSNHEYSGFTYQLAKGKVEDEDETFLDAAKREAKEELGLFQGNIILTEDLGVFMGRTTVFVSKIRDKDMFGLPSDETESTRWMTPEEFIQEGRCLHQHVVAAVVRTIKKLEGLN